MKRKNKIKKNLKKTNYIYIELSQKKITLIESLFE